MEQVTLSLADLEASETAIMDVLGANGEPLMNNGAPMQIEGYGPGSTAYAQAQAKIEAAGQARAFAALRGKAPKDNDDAKRLQAEKLAACTKRLINFPEGATPAAIYANPRLGYITTQFATFVEDWGHFLPGRAKS